MAVINRRINAADKAVLDHYYDKNLNERVTVLESLVSVLDSLRQSIYSFDASEGETDILLPFASYRRISPVVALGGVIQKEGVDYDFVADSLIRFSEPLVQGDVITVALVYQEV